MKAGQEISTIFLLLRRVRGTLIALVLMWIVTWMLFKFLRAALRRLRSLFSPDSAPA